MFGVNDLEITVYFVGEDEDDAQQGLLFDSLESAESYQQDNPTQKIYSATGLIDLTTMEEE